MSASRLLKRVERDAAIILAATAAVTFLLEPATPRLAIGVVGGGVLIGLAYWAIRGVVDTMVEGAIEGQNRRNSRGSALVKFFTRHAILALAAYGMMARLELHPMGLLIGMSAFPAAVLFEAARAARRK